VVSDRLLATLFAALFASVINTEPDLLLLEENLLRLIMRISRCHALRPPPGREPSPSVKKALARLDGDPASAIRLPELAGLAGINRYKLLRAFVREVGATPHAYLVQRRVYLARQLRIERGEVWLLACGDSYVGAAVLEERRDHLLVYSIAVRPTEQGRGHGRALLDFADQRAIAAGLAVIRLYTNVRMEKNIALYRRHGYAETGTRPHPSRAGEVLVDMVRAVPPSAS